jgi:hypothetical protein
VSRSGALGEELDDFAINARVPIEHVKEWPIHFEPFSALPSSRVANASWYEGARSGAARFCRFAESWISEGRRIGFLWGTPLFQRIRPQHDLAVHQAYTRL